MDLLENAEESAVLHRAIRNRIVGAALGLMAVGMVLVYSASAIRAERYGWDLFFLAKQVKWLAPGMLLFLVASFIDYRRLRALWPLAVLATLALLAAVRIPGIGTARNGAYRWLFVGGFSIQPSEIAKCTMVFALAGAMATIHGRLRLFKHFLPLALLIGLIAGLIAIEPDLGTAALVGTVLGCMLLAGGGRIAHAALLGMLALPPAAILGYQKFHHVQQRVNDWLSGTTAGTGYQTFMSKVALGSGGFWGVGLGNGPAKLYFLPEAHTDFIFAVAGQELGLVGTLGILGLFALIVHQGLSLIRHTPDRFGALLTFGIVLSLGLQAAFNIAVVTASIPPKGISLPFVSYGGSGLCIAMAELGLLVSISRFGWRRPAAKSIPLIELDEATDGRRLLEVA